MTKQEYTFEHSGELKDTKKKIGEVLFGARASNKECVVCHMIPTNFKDKVSAKEWSITGLCQVCQDSVYAEPEDEDEPPQYPDIFSSISKAYGIPPDERALEQENTKLRDRVTQLECNLADAEEGIAILKEKLAISEDRRAEAEEASRDFSRNRY